MDDTVVAPHAVRVENQFGIRGRADTRAPAAFERLDQLRPGIDPDVRRDPHLPVEAGGLRRMLGFAGAEECVAQAGPTIAPVALPVRAAERQGLRQSAKQPCVHRSAVHPDDPDDATHVCITVQARAASAHRVRWWRETVSGGER